MARISCSAQVGVRAELYNSPRGWDRALNPRTRKYPLAPWYLVESGEVNDENYSVQNAEIGEQGRQGVMENLSGERLMVFSIGLAREWDFVEEVNRRGTGVSACDFSQVAYRNGCERFSQVPEVTGVENRIHLVDIANLFRPEDHNKTPAELGALKDLEQSDVIYAGQFFQVLSSLETIMQGLGIWLAERPGVRKVVALHPFAEDGKNGELPWDHSIPYRWKELIKYIEAKSSRAIRMTVQHQGGYYEYVYSTIEMTVW